MGEAYRWVLTLAACVSCGRTVTTSYECAGQTVCDVGYAEVHTPIAALADLNGFTSDQPCMPDTSKSPQTHYSYQYTFTSEKLVRVQNNFADEKACVSAPTTRIEFQYAVALSRSGNTQFDNMNISPNGALVTIFSQDIVATYNANQIYGYSDWQINVPKQVLDKPWTAAEPQTLLSQQNLIFTIYSFTEYGTNLFIMEPKSPEGTSAGTRPKTLDLGINYSRK